MIEGDRLWSNLPFMRPLAGIVSDNCLIKDGPGSGKNGGGAFSHCVKSKREAASAEDQEKVENAARKCKAERKPDPAAFKAKYGGKANAFGKCVSKLARASS